ncbi:hypothetical protein Nepgr_020144 [Nepenthes gracilis]|uniref:Uncharacterized protein n=1 Tax=Nepenthes gracilis TaxID=150966 RepID=A0AAD3SUH9_NEPGR|nr:hypothetical protein Nepgr_020144 [Nepenthes gracilis]
MLDDGGKLSSQAGTLAVPITSLFSHNKVLLGPGSLLSQLIITDQVIPRFTRRLDLFASAAMALELNAAVDIRDPVQSSSASLGNLTDSLICCTCTY